METGDADNQALSGRDALIKEALSAYLAWREACARLEDAWQHWRDAPLDARTLPSEAYAVALAREAHAARHYELLLAEGATLEPHDRSAA